MDDIPIPSFGPKCPNHGCPLEVDFPMKAKSLGICPVSKAGFLFEAEVHPTETYKDKDGNIKKGRRLESNG